MNQLSWTTVRSVSTKISDPVSFAYEVAEMVERQCITLVMLEGFPNGVAIIWMTSGDELVRFGRSVAACNDVLVRKRPATFSQRDLPSTMVPLDHDHSDTRM